MPSPVLGTAALRCPLRESRAESPDQSWPRASSQRETGAHNARRVQAVQVTSEEARGLESELLIPDGSHRPGSMPALLSPAPK